MPVNMQITKTEILFVISGAIYQRISDWDDKINAVVLNEQLTTGSYHGQYPIDDEFRTIMIRFQQEGKAFPYYGMDGGRSAAVFYLQNTSNGIVVKVENWLTKDTVEFMDDVEMQTTQVSEMKFLIMGKELAKLRQWEHWVENEANSPRYIYEFAGSTLGHIVKVTDVKGFPVSIDITDYSDW